MSFDMSVSDAIPERWIDPENPHETHRKAVAAWHNREEAAWRIAGCPQDFDFPEEYPVRPTGGTE